MNYKAIGKIKKVNKSEITFINLIYAIGLQKPTPQGQVLKPCDLTFPVFTVKPKGGMQRFYRFF